MTTNSNASEKLSRSDFNMMVLEYVYDPSIIAHHCECESCGKQAMRADYDRNDGGCINSYYSVSCSHCEYHDCNDDFCATCEANYSSQSESEIQFNEVDCLLYDYEYALVSNEKFDHLDLLKSNISKHGLSLSLIFQVENSDYVFESRLKAFLDERTIEFKKEIENMVLLAVSKINEI